MPFLSCITVRVIIEPAVPPGMDYSAAGVHFVNRISGLISDICKLSGQPGCLDIQQIAMDEFYRVGPDRVEDMGDSYIALLSLQWRGV